MRVPERYRDWSQFWPPKSLPVDDVLLAQTWSCFGWKAHQVFDLVEVLRRELSIVIQPFEAESDIYGDNDPDERSICRAWASELAMVVEEWCRFLDLNPRELPDYDKAKRESVTYSKIRPEPIIRAMATFLSQRYGGTDFVFRPRCLDLAHCELMHWLARHPSDMDRVHHRTFESIVAELVRDFGWNVELTKRTRDGGYDILCLKTEVTGNIVKMVVETKLYGSGRNVGLLTVDRVMGAACRDGAQQATIVTNSYFSRDSWKRWEHRIGRDLLLVDREELMLWLSDGRYEVRDLNQLLERPTQEHTHGGLLTAV